jgi:hypothetical protein
MPEQKETLAAFTDHGVPVPANEGRTAAICTNREGETRLVIAARGYVVIVNPQERTSLQVPFPEQHVDYPFASYSSEDGMFYVGAGGMFMVLDPFRGRFTDYARPGLPGEIVGFCFAEDGRGTIYTASYPQCRLMKYEPERKTLTVIGQLDAEEKYPFSLAVDAYGWIYGGIGTERKTIAAVDPVTLQARSLVPDGERRKGQGKVHRGADGRVYGYYDTESGGSEPRWYRLEQGRMSPVTAEQVAKSAYSGTGFETVHRAFPHPWVLLEMSLAEKEVVLLDQSSGQSFPVRLSYETDGADLSPLVAGPDGRIYGTSNHPLQLYRYDPHFGAVENFGGKAIEKGGGGNICAYAVLGGRIAGAAYAGGHVHLIDTTRPIVTDAAAEGRNPQLVASQEAIYRPRCALAHPDGEHAVFGGYAGYGAIGGGLYIRNVTTGEDELLPNERLVPYHSTVCMVALPGGDLLCGTSVEAPGGGKPKETEGRLYRLDWQAKRVVYSEVPVQGEPEVALMEIDGQGKVHAFTAKHYFVYDPMSRQVIHTENIEEMGGVVRNGLVKDEAGHIYGVRTRTVFRIDTGSFKLVPLHAEPPAITAGLAYVDGRLYFASGKRLWSMAIPGYQR